MSFFETAIGIIAAPECLSCGAEGAALCTVCSDSLILPFGERCWRCNALSPNCRTCPSCRHTGAPAFVWISTNHDGSARDLLSLYKFGHQRAAAQSIARIMVRTLQEFSTVPSQNLLAVPIPTATSRMRERGFGHAELLAKKIAAKTGMQYSPALRRLGQVRQLGSKREDRLKQLNASFFAKNPKIIAGRSILLIDDVVTTGGSITAGARTLRAAGAKSVDALLFAKRL